MNEVKNADTNLYPRAMLGTKTNNFKKEPSPKAKPKQLKLY